MKLCSDKNCKQTNLQILTNFYKEKASLDGYGSKCKTCSKQYLIKWKKENINKIRKYSSKAYYKDPKKHMNYNTLWVKKNPIKRAFYSKKWENGNPDKRVAIKAKYRAAKLQRIPKWFTKSDWIEIKWAYKIAKDLTKQTGIPHEVDHIIPLQGKNISGLHCPQNLRIMSKHENRVKYNKFI